MTKKMNQGIKMLYENTVAFIDTVEALGLDFGSVDIIRSNKTNYVLEVGTACGLSPYGVECYADAILALAQAKVA